MHVDDLADACVFVIERYQQNEPLNVGFGSDVTIAELVQIIREEVGYNGDIVWDKSKPDGIPRKLLSSDRIAKLGWSPGITLRDGIRSTIAWYVDNRDRILNGPG